MTALMKAEKKFEQTFRDCLRPPNNTSRTAPGYQTIGYHQARLLIDLGKNAEATKLIDDVLAMGDEIAYFYSKQFSRSTATDH